MSITDLAALPFARKLQIEKLVIDTRTEVGEDAFGVTFSLGIELQHYVGS